ncbi:baseplate J/gp47 family protein [Aliivibrio sp. S4TY2]|uniref:baseplate J/gp47 family protein n=1 Tax=unclassified Aliivibrio TaxID=2645654 RepID=UPI00237878C8|nr:MULTISPECIES: baseplate J/gp47 family protein [unclassified Aliivibrio]MDD9155463.1 baseplate J/gp47 family protein [Aliivibrio sp. S4TY2]MDD9161590.1 baseplate J/gp47 family protein [Aliivibrio sp. S4TY1]MDD9165620.1 baseplate J/gp47 family protein [Aliivibrio sp. S4MY2]MDD9169619.1 baseplate J/gp47 family protein [Aliivibrio sp. S4MY4]MDD9186612.1 baseplate J/gp47 family protein [Aliivibrio sp. S4MY3]
MSTRPQVDFKQIIADEGIPTTEEAIAIELEKEVVAAGSKVSNDSRMSPFWRLVKAIVITPTLWLIEQLLASHVLPNTFAATASKRYLDLKAWDVDLERKMATKARGVVEFFKEMAENPIVILKGTVIETSRIEDKIYRLIVVEDVLIQANQASGFVLCEAQEAGAGYNLPAGYYSILPVGVSGITHAVNQADWVTTPGANTEKDDELALRIRNQFSVVGRYHIDAIYRSMLASVAGVRSDQIYFLHDAPRGPGTANAYILLDVGETPSHLLEQLNDFVMAEGNHGHGDDVLCLALSETQHSVSVTIWPRVNTSEERVVALKIEVENMIRAAFRESDSYSMVTRTYPSSTFSFSQLTTEIHTELAEDLLSLKFSNSDIVSELTIPRLSNVAVMNG